MKYIWSLILALSLGVRGGEPAAATAAGETDKKELAHEEIIFVPAEKTRARSDKRITGGTASVKLVRDPTGKVIGTEQKKGGVSTWRDASGRSVGSDGLSGDRSDQVLQRYRLIQPVSPPPRLPRPRLR